MSNIHSETTIFLLSTTTFVAQLFVIYNRDVPYYYFSLGSIILSRIATIAAGTIPEPPKTSWSS